MTKSLTIETLIERFKYFETLDPSLFSRLETSFDVDYFPQGNDPFLQALVESIKETLKEQIRK